MYKISKNSNNRPNNRGNRSFGNSIKHQLIDYIYSTVDLSQFNYSVLQYEEDLPKLFDKKYHLTANFVGTSCLLVFTKIRDRFHAFTVDRKTLSYHRSKVDPSKVDLNFIAAELDSSVYKGTIFDGVLVRGAGGKLSQFIVSDVYMFKGADYTNVSLEMKIFEAKTYLETSIPQMDILKNRQGRYSKIDINVNKIFPIKDTKRFIEKVVPKITDCKIRGLCFYPDISGTKLIYLFNNDKRTTGTDKPVNVKSRTSNSESDFNENKLTKYKFISSSADPVHATLEMKKTDTVDIYRLYSVERSSKKKSILVRKKMGIAYIPTTERSQWCQSVLSKSKKNSILVKCMFHNNKGKWEPIEVDKKSKFPTLFSKIDVEVMQMSDSDED